MPGIERYRRLGLCVACGKPPAAGKKKCETCLAKSRAATRVWLEGKKAAGLCVRCGVVPSKGACCPGCKAVGKGRREKARAAAIEAYGGWKCACCGEDTPEFLTLDHIESVGHLKLRAAGDYSSSGPTLLRRLRREGWPPGYQVLCWNCNVAKGLFGKCPHRV